MTQLAKRETCTDDHDLHGGCAYCCSRCNYAQHWCHFCGTVLQHDSTESDGTRHYLSDCRPDLIDGTYDGGKTVYTDGPMV